jgi:hypothetical protein
MANNFFSTNNMTLPQEGPRVVPFNIDMAVNTSWDVDLTELVNGGFISFISGAWIDNSANNHDITIQANGTYQEIIWPAGKQGWSPIHSVNPPKFTVSQSSPGDLVKIQFVNFPVFPYVIGDNGGDGGGGDVNIAEVGGNAVTDAVPVSIANPVPIISTAPTIVDYSLTLAGGDEVAVAAGDANNYLLIQNPVGNSNVTVNIAGGDASTGGAVLTAGGVLELCRGCTNAIHVAGTASDNLIIFAG